MYLSNDTLRVQLTNKDINRLKKSLSWLCDSIIMCFLRWMSFQSKKIAVIDSLSYHRTQYGIKKLKKTCDKQMR